MSCCWTSATTLLPSESVERLGRGTEAPRHKENDMIPLQIHGRKQVWRPRDDAILAGVLLVVAAVVWFMIGVQ